MVTEGNREEGVAATGSDREARVVPGEDRFLGVKTGVVKNFGSYAKPGYGFLLDSQSNEYFCHFSEIAGTGFKNLAKGQHVKFEAYEGAKGLYAKKIRVFIPGGDPEINYDS